MPKVAEALGPLAVSRLRERNGPGFWPVGGVAGLALRVTPTGAQHWVLRVLIAGKRRDIGLGAYPGVTLAAAREAAAKARDAIREGRDPLDERRVRRAELAAERAKALTFEQCAEAYIAAHKASWKNAKHRQQWGNTLAQWAYPTLGQLLVRDVDLPHVLAVFEQPANPADPEGPSLWAGKTETATRLRGRIETILDWATVRKYRAGENPARWRGHLDKLLASPRKIAKVEHHAALPIDAVGAFMKRLRGMSGMGPLALQFVILTAARSGEVRGMAWAEVDMQGAVWTVPKERMKAGAEHRVPLSSAALELLRSVPRIDGAELVFPNSKGGMLSDMTLTAVMRRMGAEAVPHGFRSTFRDWAAERTNYPREVAEMALAHTIGDKVEAAYRRGDLFEKRRRMMEDWAAFLAIDAPAGEVIPMNRASR
ncbi:tyrosine-type recombinase/integrase [Inhella sp.]|uniref:tyrosine-type recombinase/integrase n=1 Tax=Inhella sp. TaxID=1921806 RepID=UPI0035B06F45